MGCGDIFSPPILSTDVWEWASLYLRYAEKPEPGRTCDPGRGNRNVELLEAIINHGKVDLDLWRLKKMAERPFRDSKRPSGDGGHMRLIECTRVIGRSAAVAYAAATFLFGAATSSSAPLDDAAANYKTIRIERKGPVLIARFYNPPLHVMNAAMRVEALSGCRG
jgi:hypothetical protein